MVPYAGFAGKEKNLKNQYLTERTKYTEKDNSLFFRLCRKHKEN